MSSFCKRSIFRAIAVTIMAIVIPVGVSAGALDSPGLPDGAESESYTMQDLYNRLHTGATGVPASFAEPSAGPTSGTMQNINTIMGIAPIVDDTDGAAAEHVLAGKKFWGLRSGAGWGLITGALATQTPNPATVNQAAGYYEAFDLSVVDTDLAAGNIRSGVSIFGVAGTAEGATGTAVAGDVLSGKTFSNTVSSGISGTMPNIGQQNITPGTSSQAISQGYHDGTGTVAGDSDLISDNIRSGVTIFSVSGNSNVVNTSSGNAVSGDILSGKIAWVGGSQVTGNIATRTLSPDTDFVQGGYYMTTTLSQVDPDLKPDNIKKHTTIFGIDGTFEGAAIDAGVSKTGQSLCWDESGGEIDCENTGQDGELKKGVAWPDPRFTDHFDGTVTDNLTGLMWVMHPGLLDGFTDAHNWTDALKLFGVTVNNVAKWNGSAWSGAVDGLDGAVRTLSNDGSGLFAGGEFTQTANGMNMLDYIGSWDLSDITDWSPLNSGLDMSVYALTYDGSDLYAGGNFQATGNWGTTLNYIGKWDGMDWYPLADGLNARVSALAHSGDNLYAGGDFTATEDMMDPDPITLNYVGMWDGMDWYPLADGLNAGVRALAHDGSNLYAGGDFTGHVSMWNGSTWSGLGGGRDNPVRALAVAGGNLYAGGDFTGHIAMWNGSVWSDLGSGVNGNVHALAYDSSDQTLYVGGEFTKACNDPCDWNSDAITVNRIAKWKDGSWSSLGAGIPGVVYALSVFGDNLYVGGSFTGMLRRSFLGYNDWRLPNIKELLSLVDYSAYNPPLPSGHPFTLVDDYWSSTTAGGWADNAWYWKLEDGNSAIKLKTDSNYVWPVRAGQ